MKFVLLVIISVFGSALCDNHEQQEDYAQHLIRWIDGSVLNVQYILENTDETTESGANAIFLYANSFNFDIHFVLDSIQYFVSEYKDESVALQEIAFKLNNITNEVEKSFQGGAGIVKLKLQRSANNISREAKNLYQIFLDNGNHLFRSNMLMLLDDMVNSLDKLYFRGATHANPVKSNLKTYNENVRKQINFYLNALNSEDANIQNDIVRYSSKYSSSISDIANLLKDLTFTYTTQNKDAVKNIIYSLGKICSDNEEVLSLETSFHNINDHFQKTVVDVSQQLNEIIDAGFFDNGIGVKDENLIYIVFTNMHNQSANLSRILYIIHKNLVGVRSN